MSRRATSTPDPPISPAERRRHDRLLAGVRQVTTLPPTIRRKLIDALSDAVLLELEEEERALREKTPR